MADWAPTYASPLGPTGADIQQNIARAKLEVAAQLNAEKKQQRREDSKALADEQARLRARAKSNASNDDPPLRLSDQ